MKLYIIGNGFDVNHGMKTQYCNYKDYLKDNNPELLRKIEHCSYINPRDCDLWSDLEKTLELSCEDFFEENGDLYPNLGSEKTPGWDDFHLAVKNEISLISDFTCKYLKEWISSVVVPDKPKFNLGSDDYYISFNYTYTLEKTYSICKSNVFHIHGVINDPYPIFGNPLNASKQLVESMETEYSGDQWYGNVYKPLLKK